MLITLLLWAPLLDGGTTHFAWMVSRLLMLAAFFVAMWRTMSRGEIELPRSRFAVCWYVLAALLLMEAVFAKYSYIASQWVMSYATMAAVFFLVAHVARTGRSRWIERALLISGVIEACWGIEQYMWGGVSRPAGSLFNPSFFGGYLGALAAIPFARILFSSSGDLKKSSFALYVLVFILFLAGILVSGSRGAIVALIAGMTVVGWTRLGIKIIPIILLAIFAILVIPNPFQKRLKSLGEKDIYAWSRISIWRSSVSMIGDHPFGIGPGMYPYYSQQYAFPVRKAYAQYGKVAEKAHSSVFDLACELSPPGALLIIGMAVYILGIGMGAALKNKSAELAIWSGTLAAVMAHGVFDSVQKSPPSAFVGAASAGIIWAINSRDLKVVRLKAKASSRWLVLLLGVVLVFKIVAPTAAFYANQEASRSDIEDADKWLKVATTLAPNNATYWYNRASREKALWQSGYGAEHLKTALEYMEFAQELNPLEDKYFSAYAALLTSAAPAGDMGKDTLNKALEAYNRTQQIAPKNPFYYEREGEIYLKLGSNNKAIDAFHKAVEIEPNYLGARRKLAQTLKETGKVDEAEEQYRILLTKINEIPRQPPAEYERELVRVDIDAVKKEAAQIGVIVKPRDFSGQ